MEARTMNHAPRTALVITTLLVTSITIFLCLPALITNPSPFARVLGGGLFLCWLAFAAALLHQTIARQFRAPTTPPPQPYQRRAPTDE